jgi:anaerobic dimethyl sulfoxide reductase subunit B (iron-sulfur subunit)
VGALRKREEDGIVTVDREACLGNAACPEKCKKACPYDAPQFGGSPGAKMGKCDFCLARVQAGQLPDCVEACPVRALDAGPLERLRAKYGEAQTAVGFAYSRRVRPAVVFKSK